MTRQDEELKSTLNRQLERRRRRRRAGPIGLLVFGGTVGLLFTVPLVAGAYLGRWLDSLYRGYSVRWTVSLIVLGIVAGGYSVYRFFKGIE